MRTRIYLIATALIIVAAGIYVANVETSSAAAADSICIACHQGVTPGVVSQFLSSKKAAAGLDCSTCHGSDAGGAPGFPNLSDNDWLYGSTPEDIKNSILTGRSGVMPAMGSALGDEGVKEVTAYVMSLSGRNTDSDLAAKGKPKFEAMCAACHQADGKGNNLIGAPNLTDNIWLYGGSAGVIAKSIRDGRNGIMPSHRDFLGEDKGHLLAAYIYSLRSN